MDLGPPTVAVRHPDAVTHSPDGLAVIDADGVFVNGNPAAAELCGLTPSTLVGARSPFPPSSSVAPTGELTVSCEPVLGSRRELAYSLRPIPDTDRWVVSFRDVTVSRLQQRRLAAIATVASSVATERSLTGTLEALAQEVARTDSLAGVQILTVNSSGDRLHMMGAAGFGREHDFFDKLLECRAAGAELLMLESLAMREPVVLPDRYARVLQDPAWAPLHDYLRHPRWESFVSLPLLARGAPVGVLNAFFAPGQVVGEAELDFLLAMAEQAAMAVDHASLLEREREAARTEERQKLAVDLHDSVVQQVFSMMMQARSLAVLVGRGLPPAPEQVAQVADELSGVAADVLADLRGMVVERRSATTAGSGLVPALRSLLDATAARTGLAVSLRVAPAADEYATLDPDLVEDVYRVLAEAVHNTVKHADATGIQVLLTMTTDGRRIEAEVTDDGRGVDAAAPEHPAAASSGFGMTTMRERAARWGGTVAVREVPTGGTSVQLSLPVPASLPAVP